MWLFGAWLLCVGVAACDSAGDFCDAKCDCEGKCSEGEFRSCVREFDSDEERAADRGCLDLWDAYVDCVEFGGCSDGDFDKGCKSEKDNWKDCVD